MDLRVLGLGDVLSKHLVDASCDDDWRCVEIEDVLLNGGTGAEVIDDADDEKWRMSMMCKGIGYALK